MVYGRRAWWMVGSVGLICVISAGLLRWGGARGRKDDDSWKAVAREQGLDDADIDRLRRNGILVTNQAYEQVFTPYLVNRLPPFITSDSLLNAYHVLHEESVLRLERAQARRLPEILRFILDNLDSVQGRVRAEPELAPASKRRAAIVVGTALRLLDDQYQAAQASIQPLIQEEAVRITAAQVKTKPAWLGPPESDFIELDYDRYRVRGFYTQSESLARYFRAVAWLQSIPFRVANDEELLSALMLGACITPDRFAGTEAKCREYRNFFNTYRFFIGAGDDWDLVAAADHIDPERALSLEEVRRQLLKEASGDGNRPQINDQVRFAPDDPNLTAEPNSRILSAYRTPDAILFQWTTRVRPPGYEFPEGLEVCAALGSVFARDRIKGPAKAEVLATIDASKALFTGDSLYAGYLQVLAPLLDTPDPKMPAFMKGQAWQAKSCGTTLGGWTQLRHTWALQAKSNAFFAARNVSPAGFVEPEPEFYRRLAQLAARTREVLDAAQAFTVDYVDAISALREVVGVIEAATDDADAYERVRLLPYADAGPGSTDSVRPVVHFALGLKGSRQAIAGRLRGIAADLEVGKVDPAFAPMLVYYHINLESLWRLL